MPVALRWWNYKTCAIFSNRAIIYLIIVDFSFKITVIIVNKLRTIWLIFNKMNFLLTELGTNNPVAYHSEAQWINETVYEPA